MIILEFNNEIIDGQSTVADNLAKSNRNFMLLKELLENGVSQTEMEAYLKVADLVDKVVEIKVKQAEKADTALNANKLGNLERKDFVQSLLCYDSQTTEKITVEMVKNPGYAHTYMGDINFGKQVNLPGDHNQIIYLKHREIGYSTQIAIPFDGGHFTTMYIRNSFGLTWGKWNDMLSSGVAEANEYRNISDANTAIESGKLYYCVYNQCKNLPKVIDNDGILIPFMHRTDILTGFQLFMSWRQNSLYTRNIKDNQFTPWGEILTSRPANVTAITDANLATENKTYYCAYQQCKNLPYLDDGILQVFSYNNGVGTQTVCVQMWYSWNKDCVCFRRCVWGNWSPWRKLVMGAI